MIYRYIVKFLNDKPGYLKYGKQKQADMLYYNPECIIKAKQLLHGEEETSNAVSTVEDVEPSDLSNEFLTWKTIKIIKTQEKSLL